MKKKLFKPFIATVALALLSVWMALPAFAICTSATITSTSAKVLAANDLGSGGRHFLQIVGSPSTVVWCDVGNASGATIDKGYQIDASQMVTIPSTQQNAKTFPIAPSGEVDCVLEPNQATTTTTVSACDF